MAEKRALSTITKIKLMQMGIPADALEMAAIEVDTRKSAFITELFHSNATVISETIYFRSGLYNPDDRLGLALLAHEMMHLMQWNQDGMMFLLNYLVEYCRGLIINLFNLMKGIKPAKNWVHDQVGYEMKAMVMEKEVIRKLTMMENRNNPEKL